MRKRQFMGAIMAICGVEFCALAAARDDYVQIGKDKLWNAPRPDLPDLSVQFISRAPRYPGLRAQYVKIDDAVHGQGETGPVTIENAEAQHGPKPGRTVVFTAVVRNVGTRPVAAFDWHWLYDGQDCLEGQCTQALAPDATTEFRLARGWEDGRHFIAFQVDRDQLVDETCEENNWVIDRTDALSFAFFVEESVRAAFKNYRSGLGSYDWADWAQFQVRQMNKEFRDTIYPSCPDGIEQRVRLDVVYIIPDGWGHAEGMHTPGVKTPVKLNHPEFYDANQAPPENGEVFTNVNGGVDGVWGFTVDLLKPDEHGETFYTKQHRWLTGSEWPLHHELGHQLGRIDNYLIWSDKDDNPAAPGVGYALPPETQRGMMHHGNHAHDDAIGKNTQKWDATYRFYCEQTARSFNRDLGVRRGLFGEYLFDVPARNTFTFLTTDHTPVGGAKVEVFVGRGRGYTGCGFNATPNFVGTTDAASAYTLDRSPWDHVFIWGNNGVVMFRVTPNGGSPLVGLLDIMSFNLAYWRGERDDAQYVVVLRSAAAAASK
jgi:hypothetical protein